MLTIGLWICVSISSAVTSDLRTLLSLPPSNSKTKLQNGFRSTKIPEVAVFKAHHIPQSMVERKREEFRNLKQGSLSVYDYNKLFQKLARFTKQDVPDEKSMIYQFRGGLREEIQLALVLFEPLRYDEFYNMALKQEAAQLRCDASKKRVRDVTPSSSTQVAKQQKYWLPPPPFRQPYQ